MCSPSTCGTPVSYTPLDVYKRQALILKEFPDTKKQQLKIVLRLITVVDNPKFKNSIITFMRINEKEWERLLRNKQILYKRE